MRNIHAHHDADAARTIGTPAEGRSVPVYCRHLGDADEALRRATALLGPDAAVEMREAPAIEANLRGAHERRATLIVRSRENATPGDLAGPIFICFDGSEASRRASAPPASSLPHVRRSSRRSSSRSTTPPCCGRLCRGRRRRKHSVGLPGSINRRQSSSRCSAETVPRSPPATVCAHAPSRSRAPARWATRCWRRLPWHTPHASCSGTARVPRPSRARRSSSCGTPIGPCSSCRAERIANGSMLRRPPYSAAAVLRP